MSVPNDNIFGDIDLIPRCSGVNMDRSLIPFGAGH
jgi:Zn-finger nucleic acid-binding protein